MTTRLARTLALAAALASAAMAAPAAETSTVRFAYLTAVDLLPFYVADKKGYFAEAGLKVEPLVVTGGAAVVGAVVGGSAEVGYAGTVPLIAARIQGLPVKYFAGLALDKAPGNHTLVYMAHSRSGIRTAKDLAGKTVAMNARSGQCELIARLRLAEAGLSITDVKVTTIPFPQMQAALQLGSVDAACNNDPFLASMKKAGLNVPVMAGLVAKEKLADLHLHSGMFSSETWLAQNPKAAAGFRSALDKAMAFIAGNDAEARRILAEYTKIEPEIAGAVELSIARTEITPAMLQPVIDAAAATGITPKAIPASELIDAPGAK